MPSEPKTSYRLRPTREMARRRPPESISAREFWGKTRSYREAADALVALCESRPERDRGVLSDPINYLYVHTIELALKAFLRAHGCVMSPKIWKAHKLTPLYEECVRRGLVVPPDNRGIAEIVRNLDSGNAGHGFRYFVPGSAQEPAGAWTQEVVDALLRAVEPAVLRSAPAPTDPEFARVTFTFGKPEPKDPKNTR
jgi:hypothetical protein